MSYQEEHPLWNVFMKIWTMLMVAATVCLLGFYVFQKDSSVIPFIVLGLIGLLMPPLVRMYHSHMKAVQAEIEYENRIRQAHIQRIKEARAREADREKLAQMFNLSDSAEKERLQSLDVTKIGDKG